jgi:hypothetical protein
MVEIGKGYSRMVKGCGESSERSVIQRSGDYSLIDL